ncbi:nucleic acid-binding protein [Tilletiaria anomala UBC 951]|uniref:Nucleic acid-binding protein n=1 Tax=Tilletiaria anomala (strain ATCC 24038 / CBS 436.72 / UBC 951) TaxID=1037660 RepID=A0A066WEG4_TILAU|nr:nucleic acid-binding protein [Tilletiaria anomala UBC 951]KDN52161.1 nucleic acid-binding protein [Tilletiaria anomala UBC 951]
MTNTGASAARQLIYAYAEPFLQPGSAPVAATGSTSGSLKDYVKDLASKTTKPECLLGDKQADNVVSSWLDKAEALFGAAFSSVDASVLHPLEKEVEPVVYLAPGSVEPTAADLSLFAYLHPLLSSPSSASTQHAYPSLARYTSHISNLFAVASAVQKAKLDMSAFEPVYEGMPKIERVDLSKEKAKAKEAKAKAASKGAAAGVNAKQDKKEKATTAGATSGAAEGDSKSKKEKSGGNNKGGAAAASEPSRPLPSQIDLRVGKIVDIKKHPDADSLYLETVDFGESTGPRTVLSGLVRFVPIEAMQDRMVVGICNLKPVAMRGIKSHAMLLCATHKDGAEKGGVEPILPPEGSKPGDKLWIEGFEGKQPEAQLNPKKKVFETIQPGYLTTAERKAGWKGVGPDEDADSAEPKVRLIIGENGPCYAPNFDGATLS